MNRRGLLNKTVAQLTHIFISIRILNSEFCILKKKTVFVRKPVFDDAISGSMPRVGVRGQTLKQFKHPVTSPGSSRLPLVHVSILSNQWLSKCLLMKHLHIKLY